MKTKFMVNIGNNPTKPLIDGCGGRKANRVDVIYKFN
jgi:hypothetical protein